MYIYKSHSNQSMASIFMNPKTLACRGDLCHVVAIRGARERRHLTKHSDLFSGILVPSQVYRTHRMSDRVKMCSGKDDERNADKTRAWKSFQNTRSTQGQQRATPSFDRRRKVSSPLDAIRKEEDMVLGAWSSTAFTQVGIALVAVLLILMVVVSGGAPTDSRCTLPWC